MVALRNIGFLASAVLALGVLSSCKSNEMEKVLKFSRMDAPPIRSTTDVTYTYTDSGRVENILHAGRLDQYQSGDSTYSEISNGFSLTFFDKSGNFDGKLTAKNGYIGDGNNIMIARDSVIFRNKEGETLHTEELIWVQDSAMVYTDKFVTIERADAVIYGKGLTSNQNFTKYAIKNVSGEMYLKAPTKNEKEEQ